MNKPQTIVIGGGWSGLAAAVTLSQQGYPVVLLEAAKHLGGRARSVDWDGLAIDNGQHLMIGGYHTMLAMLNIVGADINSLFDQRALDIHVHDAELPLLKLGATPYLPWRLALAAHCLRHNGIATLWQISRLQTDIKHCQHQPDQSVRQWLNSCRQSSRLIRQLWEPLCLATLNTPISEASAHVFATVIKDMFRSRQAAQLLIPKKPLGEIFPALAHRYIENLGGAVKLKTRVTGLEIEQNTIKAIHTTHGSLPAQQVILAASPNQNQKLLPDNNFQSHCLPIITVYLQFSDYVAINQPMVGLTGGMSQWLFNRQPQRPGLFAVVISGPGRHEQLNNEQLVKSVCAELRHHFPVIPVHVQSSRVIREKRATFACTVGIQNKRPVSTTTVNGLMIAGDYTASPYPATLESAMASGQQAALSLIS